MSMRHRCSWLSPLRVGLLAAVAGAMLGPPAASAAAGAVPVAHAGFEEWEQVSKAPTGWDLGDRREVPRQWQGQVRPDEQGYLRRVVTPPADRERFGEASLFLDGRMLMAQPLAEVRDRTLEIAFWAKGENASVEVRLFEYTSAACAPLDFLADVADVRTDGEWREYSSLVTMWPCHGAGFAKIEIHGRGVLLDNLRVTPVEAGGSAEAAAAYRGNWSIPLLAKPTVIDGRVNSNEWTGTRGSRTGFLRIIYY